MTTPLGTITLQERTRSTVAALRDERPELVEMIEAAFSDAHMRLMPAD